MDDIRKDELRCKTNMDVVDKLLMILSDWREVVLPRHVKFIDSYFKCNKDLNLAGIEFNFSKSDMLFIFWRIQKTLQKEYCRRVMIGDINKRLYFYKAKEVPRKKQVIQVEPKLKSNVYQFKEKSLN